MTVLEPGKPVKSWSRESICTGKGNGNGGCEAKLLVEKSDLFQTYQSCMGRDENWFVTFECPICSVGTDIEGTPFRARELPTHKEWLANKQPEPTA